VKLPLCLNNRAEASRDAGQKLFPSKDMKIYALVSRNCMNFSKQLMKHYKQVLRNPIHLVPD